MHKLSHKRIQIKIYKNSFFNNNLFVEIVYDYNNEQCLVIFSERNFIFLVIWLYVTIIFYYLMN